MHIYAHVFKTVYTHECVLYVYNERDPGRLNVQDCETFISSSDESELERFHFLIAAICVYIYTIM
jgi:hypothetical protein